MISQKRVQRYSLFRIIQTIYCIFVRNYLENIFQLAQSAEI